MRSKPAEVHLVRRHSLNMQSVLLEVSQRWTLNME